MQDALQILIPLGFIAFFALMVFAVIRSQKKATEARRLRAAQLGFSPVANPDPRLIERISRLRQTPNSEQIALKNLFCRRMPDGDLYLFDMETSSKGDDSSIAEDMLMIVSPTLSLPRFGIFPRLGSSLGMMGRYLEKAVSWALKRSNLVIVPVDAPRSFAERYMLLAESPETVRGLLASGVLEQIAAVENLHIEADGDAFAFSSLTAGRQPNRNQDGSITSLIDQAQRVFYVLQGYRRLQMY